MVSGGEYILLDKQYRHEDKRIFYCSDLRRGSGHSPCLPVGRCGGIRGDASTMWTIIPGMLGRGIYFAKYYGLGGGKEWPAGKINGSREKKK